MVGSKRCYICGEPFERDDDVVECEHCHIRCHRACSADREEDHCPHCVDEGWIGVVEF